MSHPPPAEAGFSGASRSLSTAEHVNVLTAGEAGAKMVPIAGNFVSMAATATDFHQTGKDFDACMAGH